MRYSAMLPEFGEAEEAWKASVLYIDWKAYRIRSRTEGELREGEGRTPSCFYEISDFDVSPIILFLSVGHTIFVVTRVFDDQRLASEFLNVPSFSLSRQLL